MAVLNTKSFYRFAIILGVSLSPSMVFGDTFSYEVRPGTTLYRYVSAREHISDLAEIAKGFEALLGRDKSCGEQLVVLLKAILILDPVEIDTDFSHPTKGAWVERFEFSGCGATRTHNVAFRAQSGLKPRPSYLFPGVSMASMQLFMDARDVAFATLVPALIKELIGRSCERVLLADTRVTKLYHDIVVPDRGTVSGVWEETWIFVGCSAGVKLEVSFVPDGKGGTSYTFRSPTGAKPPSGQ